MGCKGFLWIFSLFTLNFSRPLLSENPRYFIYSQPNIELLRSTADYLIFRIKPSYTGQSSSAPRLGLPECRPQEYLVQYSEKDEESWHAVDSNPVSMGVDQQIKIKHLMPSKPYYLRVIGCCNYCKGRVDILEVKNEQIHVSGPHMTGPLVTLSYELTNESNTLRLTWDIYKPSFGQILERKITLNHTRIACQQVRPTNNMVVKLRDNWNYIDLPLEPYSRYNATLNIKGNQTSFTGRFGEEFATLPSDITDNEKLPIKEISTNTSDATVYFNEFECQKVNGPLCINYHVYSTNHSRCAQVFSSSSSEGPFPSQLNIKGLSPYCNYTFQIWLTRNCKQQTKRVALDLVTVATKATVVADKIRDLTVTSRGPTHISLRWLPSDNVTGKLAEYKIRLYNNRSAHNSIYTFAVKACSLWPLHHCHEVTPVNSMASYTLLIFAVNENNATNILHELDIAQAEGRFGRVETETNEATPEDPYNVKVNWTTDRLLNVSWNHPNATNGRVKHFKIYIDIVYSQSTTWNSSERYPINDVSEYKFEYFKVLNLPFYQKKKVKEIRLCVVTQNSYSHSECKSPIKALLPLEPMAYRKQSIYDGEKLVVPNPDIDNFLEEIYVVTAPASAPAEEVERELAIAYRAIESGHFDRKKTLQGFNELIRKKKFSTSKDLEQFSRIQSMFIHRKLGFEEEYLITLFIVNDLNGKRTVLKASQLVKIAEKKTSIYGIIGAVLGVLLIIPILGYLIFRYKHKLFRKSTRIESSIVKYSTTDDVAPLTSHEVLTKSWDNVYDLTLKTAYSRPVKVETLRSYIKKALESNELLKQHQLFPKSGALKDDPRFTCVCGSLPQNKLKNRYNNIVAYDHTRVKLNKKPGDDFSDYINANYIDGYKIPKAYIAAQGPKPNTLIDFWTMIWENHVKHIVMLTNLYDGEKKNCEQYWPNENDILNFEGLRVELIRATDSPTYDVRELSLKFGGGGRKVVQIHFKMWPSLGQPLFPQTLVPLMKKMLTIPYSTKSPILVHCSAGVGRTGTIILCDICLRMAAAEGVVDILGTLESLRSQRPNMVDNVEQYKLAHLVILDTLTAWNTNIPCDGNFESAVELTLDTLVLSQFQYIRECEWQDDAMKTVANAVQKHVPIVQEKNRYPEILPDEICQVFLHQIPQQGPTSCYINAVRVNSFLAPNRYIVTQHPLPHTVVDFWRLVFEQHVTIIVNVESPDSAQFWPEQQNRMDISETMEIQHVKTVKDKEISIYKLRTVYRPDDFEQTRLTVEIVNFNGWPRGEDGPKSIEDFVSFVVDSTSIAKNVSPIIVTCHDGATASGLFVALSNLIEQMETEKTCDVCQTVRTLRICRKQFVNNEIQIKMLYKAALVYARDFGVYNELER